MVSDACAGIAIDPEGHVWVADEGNNRIEEFSVTGEYLSEVSIETPRGLRFDAQGDLWVAHGSGVQELSASNEVLQSFGSEGFGDGQFKEPWGVGLDTEGNVWVADSGNDRIQELGAAAGYAYARKYPSSSPAPLAFEDPKGIATDASGDVWVADTANHRIHEVFDTGEFVRQLSASLVKPEGIAVDGEDRLWVTDEATDKVSGLSSTGALIRSFGSEGAGDGQFKEPAGIVTSSRDVYVVDHGDGRRPGTWRRERRRCKAYGQTVTRSRSLLHAAD